MTARVRPAGRSPARAAHGSREPLGRKGVHDAIYVNELDSACKKSRRFGKGAEAGAEAEAGGNKSLTSSSPSQEKNCRTVPNGWTLMKI